MTATETVPTGVWTDLIGQERVVRTLQRAVGAGATTNRHAMTHAWLITGPPGSGRSNAARAFAAGPLRLALAAGDSLDDETRHKVARRYAELTGLDERYVYDSNLRVSDPRFRKALLHDEDKIVGRYDGRVAGYDLDRMNDEETFVVDDAWLDPAYSSLCNAYLRDELGWEPRFTSFEAGLADTIDWYRANEAWWRPVKDATEARYASQGQ